MTENGERSNDDVIREEFQKAVLVLEAATAYGLPSLQKLAQAELKLQGKQMNLRSAISAIKEDFLVDCSHANTWLQEYVLKKVRDVFKHTPDVFCDPDFFASIESPSLARILAHMVVTLYNEEMLRLRTLQLLKSSATAEEHNQKGDEAVLVRVQSSVKQTPAQSKKPFSSSTESYAVEYSLPAADGEDIVESGGALSETSSNENTGTERSSMIIPCPLSSLHTDSEKEIESASKAPIEDPFAGMSKKGRLRLEKKLKREADAKEREVPEQNIAREETPIIQKYSAAETEATPIMDPKPEISMVDPFVGLSKSQKKKLEKKLKENAAALAKERKEVFLIKLAHDLTTEGEEKASAIEREQEEAALTTTKDEDEAGTARLKVEEETLQGQLVCHEKL